MLGFIFCLSLFLGLFGCVDSGVTDVPKGNQDQAKTTVPECSIVTVTEPYEETLCWNITYTEEVCDEKALKYSITRTNEVDLCTDNGACAGKTLIQCSAGCDFAMKRCRVTITNKDEKNAGVWMVGANFSIDHRGFIKDPVSQTIKAGGNYTFDFTQLYNVGITGSSADCSVYVLESPVVEECHSESRTVPECKDVTSYKKIEREVCE